MRRFTPATAVALMLALPAAAQAAPAPHKKHHSHHSRSHHARGHKAVSFYARIVRSGPQGVVLRTLDGRTIALSPSQIAHRRPAPADRHKHHNHRRGHRARAAADMQIFAGDVAVNILGLQPGVMVLVTIAPDGSGGTTITITLPPASVPGVTNGLESSGVVSDLGTDSLMVQTGDGSSLRLHMAQDALAALGLKQCDTVDVQFHQDAGMLIADKVTATGHSSTGDCAPAVETKDAQGAITAVSADSLTVQTQDQGSLTFAAPSGLTDGFQMGDSVDVVYTTDADGKLTATQINYVQENTEGKVVAVSDGSITILDDDTGAPVTLTADPAKGLFDGVALHDEVQITYHRSGGNLVADAVCPEK